MYLHHQGVCYGVGQGLFATGHVHPLESDQNGSFSYVYDCGTSSKQIYLKKSIEEAMERGLHAQPLSFLFLSHMHFDHVSGLNYLLSKLQNGVKNVILPYLYPAERVVVAALASSRFQTNNNEYLSFLAKPGEYLRERGAEEVYFVHGGDKSRSSGEVIPPLDAPQGERNSLTITTVSVDNEVEGRIKEYEATAQGDTANNSIRYVTSNSSVIAPNWFFRLYNMDIDESRRRRFLCDFGQIGAGWGGLGEILRNREGRRRVKMAYENAFGRADRLNASSLAVLSACPVGQSNPCYALANIVQGDCGLTLRDVCVCLQSSHSTRPRASCVGLVYTGDLPVHTCWESLSRKFGLHTDQGGTVVSSYHLPHHGSASNWHTDQLGLAGCPLYIASARKDSKKHPAPSVLREIVQANHIVACSNEDRSVLQQLQIHC